MNVNVQVKYELCLSFFMPKQHYKKAIKTAFLKIVFWCYSPKRKSLICTSQFYRWRSLTFFFTSFSFFFFTPLVLHLAKVNVTIVSMRQDPTEVVQAVQILQDGTLTCAFARRFAVSQHRTLLHSFVLEILGPIFRPCAGAVGPGFFLVHDTSLSHVVRICTQQCCADCY